MTADVHEHSGDAGEAIAEGGDARDAATHANRSLLFHVSLAYNLLLRHDTRRPWWSSITRHVILGALPLREKNHLEILVESMHVEAVVTMNAPEELLPNWFATPVTPEDWAAKGVRQCFGKTGDFTAPSLETIRRCVTFLDEQVREHRTTYVHCKAGRGRSTVVVVAYLMQTETLTLDDAYALVRRQRPHISLHPKQRHVLSEFAASL